MDDSNDLTPRNGADLVITDDFKDLDESELKDLVSESESDLLLAEKESKKRDENVDQCLADDSNSGYNNSAIPFAHNYGDMEYSIVNNENSSTDIEQNPTSEPTFEKVDNTECVTPEKEHGFSGGSSSTVKKSRIRIGVPDSPLRTTEMTFVKEKVCISPCHGRSYSEGYQQWSYIPVSAASPLTTPIKETQSVSSPVKKIDTSYDEVSH